MRSAAADRLSRWPGDHQLWVEVFVLINLLFITLDIYMAHSVNQFRRQAEYIPLYFSMAAPVALLIGLVARERWQYAAAWRDLGYLVGWLSVLIGLAGVLFHLESQFFIEKTLRSLTYAAPFAAPLAYTGLGFLLILNRMVDPRSEEWARWVLLLTLGGFAGNFVLSLTDHAANGFYRWAEWIPVVSSAFAVGFLAAPFFVPVTRRFVALCYGVLAAQAVVGVVGFLFHAMANMNGVSVNWFDNMINGAPPMAPLLLPNLSVLGGIALWVFARQSPAVEAT